MDASLYGTTPTMTAMGRDPDLRAFARWEYGDSADSWLARTAVRPRGPGLGSRLQRRLRAWIDLVRRPVPSPGVGVED